jgi:release factor glutamine methyltransferase
LGSCTTKTTLQALQLKVAQRLRLAEIEEPEREAQHLICTSQNWGLHHYVLNLHETLGSGFQHDKLNDWVQRRENHEPMAYIMGKREFFGRDFSIGPGALIPRPDTETLIEWVLEDATSHEVQRGIDLCCGPGTLGLTLSQELKRPFDLVDISPDTLAYGKKNSMDFQLEDQCRFHQLDVLKDDLTAIPKTNLIVCNPPYISKADLSTLMPDVIQHEPVLALDGGTTGLEFFISLLDRIHTLALPGCRLYVELGHDQRPQVDAFHHPNWTRDAWRHDLAGISRVVRFTFSEHPHG